MQLPTLSNIGRSRPGAFLYRVDGIQAEEATLRKQLKIRYSQIVTFLGLSRDLHALIVGYILLWRVAWVHHKPTHCLVGVV